MPLPKSFKVKRKPQANIPLWKGPYEDGITQSMISRFLHCRERFRLLFIHGLKPHDDFNPRIEYGNMWHVCEEALAKNEDWLPALKDFCQALAFRYRTQNPQIQHWYEICKVQFPIYVDYWKKHKDVTSRTPIYQEEVFDVKYSLDGKRIVRLRGKYDAVDLIGKGRDAKIYLQENKSKGDIDEEDTQRRLTFDLQTMLYLTTLHHWLGDQHVKHPIAGVRYNAVRRPLAGGRHSIRQHKPTKAQPQGESLAAFYHRLGGLIKEDAGYFFMRWTADITPGDLAKFQATCLNPVLHQICDWWEFMESHDFKEPFGEGNRYHFRFPYGVYNPTLEGRASEIDEYLESGSEVGLQRVQTLFGEL